MGYLVCEKCHSKYRLKPGELPSDFSVCSCGGKLQYVKDLNSSKPSSSGLNFRAFGYKLSRNKMLFAGVSLVLLFIVVGLALAFLDHGSSNPMGNNSTENDSYFADVQVPPQSASQVVMGANYIKVPQGAKVVTQVDRIIKDPATKINLIGC